MTPERLDLARINAEIAQTATQRDEAQGVIDRLTGPQSEVAQVEASLAQLRAQCARDRAAWNEAGSPGDPPVEPRDLATGRRSRRCVRDGANDGAVESARSARRRAEESLAVLVREHRSAHLRAAAGAVRERLDARVIPQLVAAMNEVAVVDSIATVLENQWDPESVSMSREIKQMIVIARRSFGVRGDQEAARRFLNDLAENAAAQVPDSGPPTVEHLDPGIPRAGVPDGTMHLNIGPVAPNPTTLAGNSEMATPAS